MYDVILFTECNGSIGWGRDAGAYTVSSRLREAGYKVKVIDFFSHFTFDIFKRAIDNYVTKETAFIGFSSTHFSTLKPEQWEQHWQQDNRTRKNDMWNVYFPFSSNEMAEWITYAKNKNPNLKIVVGGQKVAQKIALQKMYPFVDFWVGGMADVSVIKIIEHIKENKMLPTLIKSEEQFGAMSESAFIFSKIHWNHDDLISKNEALPLEISRGCPFKCTFCDYQKKNPNTWTLDAEHLKNVLLHNYEMFGTHHYMITDFQVNENIKKMEMIHKVFTSLPFTITWSGFGRLDLLNAKPEMIDLISESGCKSIQWGIETITDKVGPLVNKVTKRAIIEKTLDSCRKKWGNSIVMGSGFILGLPGETKESCKDLIKWIEEQPWLDAWEITPLYIGNVTKGKEYTIDYSKIQRNPELYGYNVTLEKNKKGYYVEDWVNEDMKKSELITMIEDSQKGQAWQRRLMTSYLGYSRCSNLGFTHEELIRADKNNLTWIREHAEKYRSLGELHLSKNKLK